MTFLSGVFLWALMGLSVPVIIALWNIRRFRRVDFGAYFLLRKISESTRRRVRLLELLKLLNRIVLIALVVLIFAEPFQKVMRIGDAEQGFVVLLDVGRVMQLTSGEGPLTVVQQKKALTLLESMPSQAQGLVGFVSDRCEIGQIRAGQLTGRAVEWIRWLKQAPIPYRNRQTKIPALQSCLSKARALFADRKIFSVFISPLPDSLEAEALKTSGVLVEGLEAPTLPKLNAIELQQELREGILQLTVKADEPLQAEIFVNGRLEPLGKFEDRLDLPAPDSGFLILTGEPRPDAWGAKRIFALHRSLQEEVHVWAAKESQGFLSLLSALRNHPQIKVSKHVGGIPEGSPLIIYGDNPHAIDFKNRILYFLNPEGTSPFSIRDKKHLASLSSSSDLLKAFQFQTPQGRVTIRRYALFDTDRYLGLMSFEDGAPSLYRDREAEGKIWIVPFDLEDLTTDLTLESAFIPYLYTILEQWLGDLADESRITDFKPLWLMPGSTTPAPSVLREADWPGIYGSGRSHKLVLPEKLPTGFLSPPTVTSEASQAEENFSFREWLQKALVYSIALELLLCLLGVPGFLLSRALPAFFMGMSLLVSSAEAVGIRKISVGLCQGFDRDRKVALEQFSATADRLANLQFEVGATVSPVNFWKSGIVFCSSSGRWGPFTNSERQHIRDYLERGGLLIFDDPLAIENSGFVMSVRKELMAIFPNRELKKVSREDVLFRSYYLLNEVSGRKLASPSLEGLNFDNRWVAVISSNDLLGAQYKTPQGDYGFAVSPYGISQRILATRLLLNLVMYGATIDYKDDAIHLPHILKRRVR